MSTAARKLRFFRRPRLQPLEARDVPATYIVTNLNDFGLGTLRNGVDNTNVTPEADTITFDPSLFGTIKLSGELKISEPLTIIGPGGSFPINVSGQNVTRVFNTSGAGSGTAITISGLQISGGKASGSSAAGIYATEQHLTLTDCLVSGNNASFTGGGVWVNGGILNATDCTFTNNSSIIGGGVAVSGVGSAATFDRCTVSGNTSSFGGGIYAGRSLILTNTTISGNSATDGGGVEWRGDGPLSIKNCTVSGNSASSDGGGISLVSPASSFTLQNSTVTDNTATGKGGGLFRSGGAGTMLVESAIVSKNSAPVGVDIFAGTVTVNRSAIGKAAGFTLSGFGNLPFDTDLKLGLLSNNGGPTKTHRPANDSPVIDQGSNISVLAFDQRGVTRVIGAGADIGSVEVPTALVVTNANDAGKGSLRQNVTDANIDPVAEIITFDPVFFATAKTITLTTGEMPVTAGVSIFGPSLSAVAVSGNNSSRIFNMNLPALVPGELYLSGMTLIAGKTGSTGGAIMSNRPVILFGCGVTLNNAGGSGGAVWASELTADYSIFSSNSSGANGGAVSAVDVTATNCSFQNNTAAVRGGAIDSASGLPGNSAELRRCTVWSNSAPTAGGAYFQADVVIEQSTVAYCKATAGRGGGLHATGNRPVNIRNSTISNNTANADGGAIALLSFDGTLTVWNSTVTANSAGPNAGGIVRVSGVGGITLESTIVSANTSAGAKDLFTSGTVNAKFSAVGSAAGVATFNADATTTALLGADLKLGPLAHNGGPTFTHFLNAGSPARDKGSNPAPAVTFDQRGALRTFGPGVDIGALEVQADSLFVVDITADESDGIVSPGDLSLREALEISGAALESADTVRFHSAVFAAPTTINLVFGQIFIGGPVQVQGTGASMLTVHSAGGGRVFYMYSAPAGTDIRLSGLTLSGGTTYGIGGAIVASNQDVTLTRCVLVGNTSIDGKGGAVAIEAGTLTAVDCTFANNTADVGGGAIYSLSNLTLQNCTFNGNQVPNGKGGAVHHGGLVNALVRNSTLSGNNSKAEGGGIALVNFDGTLTVQNSTITANAATAAKGGGINLVSGTGTINVESSIVSGNTAVTAPDIASAGTVNVNRSAIGSPNGFTLTGSSNLPYFADLKLGSLVDNGGPTQTHALLAGSPCINAGSNPAGLTYDQRGVGFPRSVKHTDIGAFEDQTVPPPTALVKVNDGAAQRSTVTSVRVTFSEAVSFPAGLDAAIKLVRTGPGGPTGSVTLAFATVGNDVIVTFNDPTYAPGTGKSLIDGTYTLTLDASAITGAGGKLDGDGNGMGGDDLVTLTHRLFGDADGDRDTDVADYAAFRGAFGSTSNLAFDSDGDGDVDAADYAQFRGRFGSSV